METHICLEKSNKYPRFYCLLTHVYVVTLERMQRVNRSFLCLAYSRVSLLLWIHVCSKVCTALTPGPLRNSMCLPLAASVGHMEPSVDAARGVQNQKEYLQCEVEDVESSL